MEPEPGALFFGRSKDPDQALSRFQTTIQAFPTRGTGGAEDCAYLICWALRKSVAPILRLHRIAVALALTCVTSAPSVSAGCAFKVEDGLGWKKRWDERFAPES